MGRSNLSQILSSLLFLLILPAATVRASMAPAFLWSNSRSYGLESHGTVDYQMFSLEGLMDHLLHDFGWSDLRCSNKEEGQVEAVVAFVGKQLHSWDISHSDGADADLISVLRDSFTLSNYSMAIPYVAMPKSKGPVVAKTLLASVGKSNGCNAEKGKLAVVGSCAFGEESLPADGLRIVEDVKEFLDSRKSTRRNYETDFLLVCTGKQEEAGKTEGAVVAEVLSALRDTATIHTSFYVSDISEARNHYKGRQLAGMLTSNSTTCDAICQTKVDFLESLFVALVLLIILVAGLCCMMGVETPKRFETAQES